MLMHMVPCMYTIDTLMYVQKLIYNRVCVFSHSVNERIQRVMTRQQEEVLSSYAVLQVQETGFLREIADSWVSMCTGQSW